jgi:hypothetical protein
MPHRPPVQRSRAWVEREYGDEKWPAMETLVERAIEDEQPEADLARVLARVTRNEWDRRSSPFVPTGAVMWGEWVEIPDSVAFAAHQALIVEAVLGRCRGDTELLLELGSGWGRNVFAIWLAGGPRRARYVAAEYTAAGRRASERLAALAPRLSFESRAFDYNRPDLQSLSGCDHAVVFTVHSVEQVPRLSSAVIDAIRSVAAEVDCVHLEPVGWQLEGMRQTGPGSSREYAERHDYNRDLVQVLRAAEAAGSIRIEEIAPEAVGVVPDNPTTMIHWRATPR